MIKNKPINFDNDYEKIKKDKNKIIQKIEYPYLKYYMTEDQVINNFNNLIAGDGTPLIISSQNLEQHRKLGPVINFHQQFMNKNLNNLNKDSDEYNELSKISFLINI